MKVRGERGQGRGREWKGKERKKKERQKDRQGTHFKYLRSVENDK